MHNLNLCRLCLTENENAINIFDENGKNLKIALVLSKHFSFQIIENDNLSNIICSQCWRTTEEFHLLYEKVQVAQTTFINFIIPDAKISTDDHFPNSKIKYENSEDTIEIKLDLPKEPVKYESDAEDFLGTVVEEDPVKIGSGNSSASDVSDKSDLNPKLQKRKKAPRKLKPLAKLKSGNSSASDESDESDNNSQPQKRKRAPRKLKSSTKLKSTDELKEKLEKEDVQIRDFFKMDCYNCDSKFGSFLEAKSHYRTMHATRGYLLCCKRKFYRRSRILEHIERHKNPEKFKCDICNKVYVDKFALKNHFEEHQPTINHQYKCTHCSKSFTKQFKLTQHIRIRHSEKKFSCDICGGSFATKSILNSHIRGVHQFAYAQVCDVCAKVFKSKQVFEVHRQLHFTTPPKIQCTICGSWLANDHSLRAHLARHKDVEHKCSLCDKVAPNKQALGNHMRNVHIERMFQCTMCDKSFKKPVGLKEHMALHTGETLYTCPHCPRTFKSGSNMHSHRKKAHFAEWERDRKKRAMPVKSE